MAPPRLWHERNEVPLPTRQTVASENANAPARRRQHLGLRWSGQLKSPLLDLLLEALHQPHFMRRCVDARVLEEFDSGRNLLEGLEAHSLVGCMLIQHVTAAAS